MLRILSVLILVFVTCLAISTPVLAQEPTETPTPLPTLTATPPVDYGFTLTSGSRFVVERRVTYGDIAVVIAVAVLILVEGFYILLRVNYLWLR
jgi:hypothetical protein